MIPSVHLLAVLLPFIAYFILVNAFSLQERDLRRAFVLGALVWGAFAVGLTEVFSFYRLLTGEWVALGWAAFDIILLIYLIIRRGKGEKIRPLNLRQSLTVSLKTLDKLQIIYLLVISIIVAIVGIVAIVSPPNTWDTMTYHLPRVEQWIQNRSVEFFSTHDLRQIIHPPGAEYIFLHFHLLSGGDYFDNLVQWFSFVGSIIGVSLIARQLGADIRQQLLSALFCATIPQGILYASASKNDFVLAFWLVIFAYCLLRSGEEKRIQNAVFIGLALGLALMTKATAHMYSFAIFLPWFIFALPKFRALFLRLLPIALIIALSLNAGHLLRNYHLMGSFSPSANQRFGGFADAANGTITPSGIVSNMIRNMTLHIGTPSPAVNGMLQGIAEKIISFAGADPMDPNTTYLTTKYQIYFRPRHEAYAGNPVHVLLILLSVIAVVAGSHRRSRPVVVYVAGMVLGFILFCALLRWQPWHTRLQLPLFVLWTAVIPLSLSRIFPKVFLSISAIILIVLAIPFLFFNEVRPFNAIFNTPREQMYFFERGDIRVPYAEACKFVNDNGFTDVGVDMISSDCYEYPLYKLLEKGGIERTIRYVGVKNLSRKYDSLQVDFKPSAVICLDCAKDRSKWLPYVSKIGPAVVFKNLVVFSPMGTYHSFEEYQKTVSQANR